MQCFIEPYTQDLLNDTDNKIEDSIFDDKYPGTSDERESLKNELRDVGTKYDLAEAERALDEERKARRIKIINTENERKAKAEAEKQKLLAMNVLRQCFVADTIKIFSASINSVLEFNHRFR